MAVNLAPISRDVGRFLLIPTGMAIVSLGVCAIATEWFALLPFVVTAAVSGLLSWVFQRLGRKAKEASLPQILISVALGWGLIATVGALPFWLIAHTLGEGSTPTVAYFNNFLNALFEGFSGFTSTGLTMVLRPSELPVSLQWWRSFMAWVGGVGIVVLAIALLEPTQNQYVLYEAEGRDSMIRLTVTRSVQRIWLIYVGYTFVAALLFRAVGMGWWQALNHSMSAISTGGFTVTDGNMSAYGPLIQLATIPVMIAGAISFSVHDQLLLRRRISALWQNRQHLFLFFLIGSGTLMIAWTNYRFVGQPTWVESAFQWVSALTTCGFNSRPLQFWTTQQKLLLIAAMIVGGAAGSTVGGLKLKRVLALIESVIWRFKRTRISSRQLVLRNINGKKLTIAQANRQVEEASALATMWIVSIALGVLLLLPLVPAEYELVDVIFETTSALGAAGLSVGITSPFLPSAGKCLLMLLMWMGRLEIIPVLMVFYIPFSYLKNR